MSVCVMAKCRRAMDDAWAFCPLCGTDNRPPRFRPPVLQCAHLFFASAAFCAMCGMPVNPFTPAAVAGQGVAG